MGHNFLYIYVYYTLEKKTICLDSVAFLWKRDIACLILNDLSFYSTLVSVYVKRHVDYILRLLFPLTNNGTHIKTRRQKLHRLFLWHCIHLPIWRENPQISNLESNPVPQVHNHNQTIQPNFNKKKKENPFSKVRAKGVGIFVSK